MTELTFREEEDEIIRSMLKKQEDEIREYREKYEIALGECIRLQAENERMRCCANCGNLYMRDECEYEEDDKCTYLFGHSTHLKHWKPKEQK